MAKIIIARKLLLGIIKIPQFHKQSSTSDNKGLKEIGGSVVNRNFVQLIKFGGRLTVLCSEIPNFFKPRNVRLCKNGW